MPNNLSQLPDEILLMIGEKLSLQDKARLAGTSRNYHRLFQLELNAARLLLFVVRGQQDEAYAMLQQAPELLLKRVDVTDYSGRTFRKIVAYEYAYWAKDTHMCRMLEQHMDNGIKAVMLDCINRMEQVGLTYEQQGVVITHSKHFDFTPLIEALRGFANAYNDWITTRTNERALKPAWMQVGKAQRDMPVHVANEYCYPVRSFDPRPEFNEKALPRNLIFYNYKGARQQSLFPLVSDSCLGIDFAICRGEGEDAVNPHHVQGGRDAVWRDLAAISHLDVIRTDELKCLRDRLLPIDLKPSHDIALPTKI